MEELLTKTVEDISVEWKNFQKNYENYKDRIGDLESDINEIKGGIKHMHNISTPESIFDMEEKEIFRNLIRGTPVPPSTKSYSSDQPEMGGFAVTPERYKNIISRISEISPMRILASCDTISTNVLELLIQSGDFNSGWVVERGERPETDAPRLVQKRITVHELYSQPKATQRLLDDAFVNIDEWLTEQLVQTFAREENNAFINGDGENKPKGFLRYDEIERVEIEDDRISPADLINLLNSLSEIYHQNASFLMHRRTLATIQKMQDNVGRFIWQPAIADKMPETIFGIPVYCSNHMPIPEEGASAIALGDFKAGYKIVDRIGISIMRDPYTEKPFTKFYATKRVGGDVVDHEAIKVLRF